jgi:nitric oxide reductase NorD protein
MIALSDVEDTLTLFCEGIAGRYLHIKPTREFVSRRLHMDANETGQTPDSLYFPERIDAPHPEVYHVLALEQIGQRECETFRFSLLRAHEKLPAYSRLQGTGHERAVATAPSDLSAFFALFEHPALARELFFALEFARVYGHLGRIYPGIVLHAQRYYQYVFASLTLQQLSLAKHAQAVVIECLCGGVLGDSEREHLVLSAFTDALRRSMECGEDVYCSAARVCDLYDVMDGQSHWLDAPAYRHEEETIEDWLQQSQKTADLESALDDAKRGLQIAPDARPDELGRWGAQSGQGETRDPQVAMAALSAVQDGLTRQLDLARSRVNNALGPQRPGARSYRYDEWNHIDGNYMRRWCRVFEQRMDTDEQHDVDALRAVVARWRRQVQKQFEQIRPLGLARVRRQSDGDELDLNAVVDARLDLRAGRVPDDRIYSSKVRQQRDVCVAFLVDLSASTDDVVEAAKSGADAPGEPAQVAANDVDGRGEVSQPLAYDGDPWSDWEEDGWDALHPDTPPKRKVIDVQREAMLVMSAALGSLGDAYGIFGFSGYGRDCVEVFVAKDLHEAFTTDTLRAIAAMAPKRSTRMGPAIRHITKKLSASGYAQKTLIIVSDGYPQDSDYGPHRGDHEYGLQDTAKALAEAQEKAVETFCITVDRSGHDYLKRMCPRERYMVIEEMDDLPGALSLLYQRLTTR